MATPETQEQKLINKKLVFSATRSHVNYSSRLTVEITVREGYFSKLEITYSAGESLIAGYYSRHFEFVAYHDYRYVEYTESFADANIPKSEKTQFRYELNNTGELDPEFWDDQYLRDNEKWLNNKITIDEAKKMIEDIVDYYEPEDYDNPADSFIKSLCEFVKSILADDEYKFEVELEDINE